MSSSSRSAAIEPAPRTGLGLRPGARHAAALLVLAATLTAARGAPADACYVRMEAFDATAVAGAASAPAQSFVGVRRKTRYLFDVDISIAGPDQAVCSVSGVARLRGELGADVLGLVVRPDVRRRAGDAASPCQVFVQLTASSVEVRTTPSSCQAQSLCEGKVELDGQRFEPSSKRPPGSSAPCFGSRVP